MITGMYLDTPGGGRPQVLARCAPKAPFPCHVGLSIGQLRTWQLASPEEANERGRECEKPGQDGSYHFFVTKYLK